MMKLILLNLIALIIAVTSLHVNVQSEINFNGDGTDSLNSLPPLNLDPLRPPGSKSSQAEILTQSFFEQAIFAILTRLPLESFLYYLPIYSLNRLKEFFLLI